MGYEVIYHYHEEISKGEYNREETKTKTAKIGSPYDDIPLEAVAGKIMAQLARRNILVVDVEIYEYTKKKLNYRESEDGVIIKNKKFKFDDGPVCIDGNSVDSDDPEEQLRKLLADPRVAAALEGKGLIPSTTTTANRVPPEIGNRPRKPLRYEVFSPDPVLAMDAKRRGLAFTVGKKYPIYSEKIAPVLAAGMIYETEDDNNRPQRLSDKFFVLEAKGLDEFNEAPSQTATDGLDWSGAMNEQIVDIRAR